MSKTVKIILSLILLCALLAAGAFFIVRAAMKAPGYHAFLWRRSFNYSGQCFIYDPEAGEFLEPSELQVKADLRLGKTSTKEKFVIPGLVELRDGEDTEGYADYDRSAGLVYRIIGTVITDSGAKFDHGPRATLSPIGKDKAIVNIDMPDGAQLWALYGYADENTALDALDEFLRVEPN